LAHGLIDEVINGAFQLGTHLFKDFPKKIPALEVPKRFLVLLLAHMLLNAPLPAL
jgi:hypothetical protein